MASRSGQKSVANNNVYTLCLTAGTRWWLRQDTPETGKIQG